MATKKKAPAEKMADMFAGLTEEEGKQFLSRMKRLAISMRNHLAEFEEIIGVLEKPRAVNTKTDDDGDPTYRYLVRVRIPEEIKLTKRMRAYAVEQGYRDQKTIEQVFKECVEYYRRVGTKWQDWTMVIYKWFRTDMAQRRANLQQEVTQVRTSRTYKEVN